MKLATLRSDTKNGQLVVVSRDNKTAVKSMGPASLLEAVENWGAVSEKLEQIYTSLNNGSAADAFSLNVDECIAPLPTAPGFYDGSAFLSHVVRARRSRGDEMPESARKTPLMYQGVSDCLLAHNAPIELMDPEFGGDLRESLPRSQILYREERLLNRWTVISFYFRSLTILRIARCSRQKSKRNLVSYSPNRTLPLHPSSLPAMNSVAPGKMDVLSWI